MAKQIIIPQFGTSVDTVTILTWHVHEGDDVKKGDILCEVETDKSALEIESFYTGTVLKVIAQEGDEVGIGEIIAYVGEPGEQVPGPLAVPGEPGLSEPVSGNYLSPQQAIKGKRTSAESGLVKAMPKVRKLARELNIDLGALAPSGKNGNITEEDVLSAAGNSTGKGTEGRLSIPLSKNQKAVAAKIRQSYNEIIPIYLNAAIHVRGIVEVRREAEKSGKGKISFDAYFIYAAAEAMLKYPRFQYYFKDDMLVHSGGANIGVAVSTEDELYVPVIKNAGSGNILEKTALFDSQVKEFRKQAENNKLRQQDLEDGVLLISNLGMYPVDSFSAIIPPGYSSALSIGRIRTNREPLLKDSSASIDEQVVTVMLAVDHRFINGRLAAQFIDELKSVIESL